MEERTSPRGAPIAFHTSFAAANRFDSPTVVEDQTRTLSIVLRYFAGPMLLLRFNPLLPYFVIGPRGRDDRRAAPVIHIPLELHFPIAKSLSLSFSSNGPHSFQICLSIHVLREIVNLLRSSIQYPLYENLAYHHARILIADYSCLLLTRAVNDCLNTIWTMSECSDSGVIFFRILNQILTSNTKDTFS